MTPDAVAKDDIKAIKSILNKSKKEKKEKGNKGKKEKKDKKGKKEKIKEKKKEKTKNKKNSNSDKPEDSLKSKIEEKNGKKRKFVEEENAKVVISSKKHKKSKKEKDKKKHKKNKNKEKEVNHNNDQSSDNVKDNNDNNNNNNDNDNNDNNNSSNKNNTKDYNSIIPNSPNISPTKTNKKNENATNNEPIQNENVIEKSTGNKKTIVETEKKTGKNKKKNGSETLEKNTIEKNTKSNRVNDNVNNVEKQTPKKNDTNKKTKNDNQTNNQTKSTNDKQTGTTNTTSDNTNKIATNNATSTNVDKENVPIPINHTNTEGDSKTISTDTSNNTTTRKRKANTTKTTPRKIVKKQDIHYKFDKEAAQVLKNEYANAPVELTEKWRKSDSLKNSGLSEVMKKGPFSNEEKATLRKAVNDYLVLHNIDQSLVLNLIFKRQYKDSEALDLKKHQGFWKYVSQALPNRSTESSYRCVTRMYHPDNFNGKFTEEDDRIIQQLYTLYGPSWKRIGEMIGRMGTAVKDRFNILQRKSFSGTGIWSEEENRKYKEIVQDMYNNNKLVNGMPLFTEVSKRLKTRSPKQCYVHWAFTKNDFISGNYCPFTVFDRQEYLEKLSKLKVQDETQVDWKKVANPNKPWKYFIYSRDWTSSKTRYLSVEDTNDKTFIDCVNLVLKHVNESIVKLVKENEIVEETPSDNEEDENNLNNENLGYPVSNENSQS